MPATPGAYIKTGLVRRPLCHKVNLPSCVARRPLCHKVNLPRCEVSLPSCVARRPGKVIDVSRTHIPLKALTRLVRSVNSDVKAFKTVNSI